jgi:hypothetical protein
VHFFLGEFYPIEIFDFYAFSLYVHGTYYNDTTVLYRIVIPERNL